MDWAGIDEWIYRRLTELVDVLPMRFVKLVAHNYTDARVRKLCGAAWGWKWVRAPMQIWA